MYTLFKKMKRILENEQNADVYSQELAKYSI